MTEVFGAEQLVKDLGNMANNFSEADGESAWIYTGVNYSVFQEFGSSQNPAQPFMRPAAKEVTGADFSDSLLKQLLGEEGNLEEQLMLMAMEARDKAKSLAPVDTGNLKASIVAAKSLQRARKKSRANAWKGI